MKNIWFIKSPKFGYKYSNNSITRKNILDYFNNYLFDLISNYATNNDALFIYGEIFNNVNPSIIAITDAVNCISKISQKIKVYLLSSDNDTRVFDNQKFSTLNLLSNINNTEIIYDDIIINNITINPNNTFINVNGEVLNIPNVIQYEKDDLNAAILIVNDKGKHKYKNNNYSPKHKTITINNITEFDDINNDNVFLHLNINNKLLEEHKHLINLSLFKIKPVSVKYFDITDQEKEDTVKISNFNIIDIISNKIGDDEELKKQFDRVFSVYKNKI